MMPTITAGVLVSIDPGIDRAAAAIWQPTLQTTTDLVALASRLQLVRECTTDPANLLAARLAQLTDWAGLLVEDVRRLLQLSNLVAIGDRAAVVVEWPAFAGMYRGRTHQRSNTTQPNAEAMGKLYAATGAIIGGVSRWCHQVETLPAAKTPRETKQLIGRRALESAIAREGTKASFPNNDDTRSAVAIGLQALLRTPERRGREVPL